MIVICLMLLALAAGCPQHCLACNSLFCLACAPGFQLTVDGLCTTATLPHCATYFGPSVCSQCQPTYSLVSAQCLIDYSGCVQHDLFTGECTRCLFGRELSSGVCTGVLNCKSFNSGSCTQCFQNFTLTGSSCFYSGPGCLKNEQFSGSCKECSQDYDLIGFQCILKNDRLPNCYLYDASKCLICKKGYQLNWASQCVLPPTPLCLSYDVVGNCISCNTSRLKLVNRTCVDPQCQVGVLGNCKQCISGFALNETSSLCELNDTNCLTLNFQGNDCVECQKGYFVNAKGRCSTLPDNCLAADIVKLTCIACQSGFLLQGNSCVKPTFIRNCLMMSPSQTSCAVCQSGYFLSSGACTKVSSLCNGYDPTTGMCLSCKVGYINYGGQCRDPNCQTQQGDICAQCKTNFKVQPSGLCYFYDQHCLEGTTRNCNTCMQGYYLNGDICSTLPFGCERVAGGVCQQCRNNYQGSNGLCVVPVAGCGQYQVDDKGSSCTACQMGFNLVSGTCEILPLSDPNCLSVKAGVCVLCSNRFYFTQNGCRPVNPNCKSYSMQTGNCTACYPGYMLLDGSCVPAPPRDPNCKTMGAQGCLQCYQSFFVSNGSCSPINTLCKTSNLGNGECLSCYTGYQLSRGLCLAAYSDPNCARYDQNGVCLNCSAKYYMMQGACTRVSPLCKTYSTSSGSCLTCYPGYYLAGGACWAGNDPNLDPNCNLRGTTGECLQCIASYYISSNGYCKASDPLCKTFNRTNGHCLTCYKGYVLKETVCAMETTGVTDPNCLKFLPSGLCQECYTSFYVLGGVCKEVNPLCKTSNSSDGTCLSCYPGYSLSNGFCIIPVTYSQQATDPYCLSFIKDQCASCQKGYFVQGGTCSIVDPQCQQFDYVQGRCLQCYQGYTLNEWGCNVQAQAVIAFCQALNQDQTCKTCMQGYFRSSPKVCSPASILCFTYDQNTGACLSCRGGYFLQAGACVYPSMGIDQNCISYDASAYCSQCKPGYFLNNYLCKQVDPNCVKFDYQANSCKECGNLMQIQGAGCK